jgi:hypothetical protein
MCKYFPSPENDRHFSVCTSNFIRNQMVTFAISTITYLLIRRFDFSCPNKFRKFMMVRLSSDVEYLLLFTYFKVQNKLFRKYDVIIELNRK